MTSRKRARRVLSAMFDLFRRRKPAGGGARYRFDDESSPPSAHPSPQPSAPVERHRHVDYGISEHGRPTAQTTYIDLPQSPPSKRARANSAPPPPTVQDADEGYVDYQDGVDFDYVRDKLHGMQLQDVETTRRRTAGDRPLLTWIRHINQYLVELLRLEGCGDHAHGRCGQCGQEARPAYRCKDCHTNKLLCHACLIDAHLTHPLHRIQVWQDRHFTQVSLKSLGLRVQLGHDPGEVCRCPKTAFGDDFVVLDVTGIHEVGVDFCDCATALPHAMQLLRARWYPATHIHPKTAATFRLLENFHLLSTQSKVSGWEYYTTLARLTENIGVNPSKDRYPAFMLMAREWRHLKMLKRAGRGHDPSGVEGTAQGECAVECPACPQPGKNLPPDWQSAPIWKRWMYRIYLSMDANFHLKRKKVSNEANDPSLSHGYAYVAEALGFKEFLATYGTLPTEKHSHCNNHNAVKLANLKNGSALAATGVGAVECARHGLKRPCSVGDLQKGERYLNMDYLLHHSLMHNAVDSVTLIYDIVCQYSVNIFTRFSTYGFTSLAGRAFQWAIPKFHIAAHREFCRCQYALHYLPFTGHFDGEYIERNWAQSNCMASSTKAMGPGSRNDHLDDTFGDQNWLKITKLPNVLLAKIKDAVPERQKHTNAFKDYTAALPESQVAEWKAAVETWEADTSNPNPFAVERPDITEDAIRLRLLEQDAEDLRLGRVVVLHTEFSTSTMLAAGLDLEEQQREHTRASDAIHEHATDLARANLLDKRNSLHRRLEAWFKVQALFMPGVLARRDQLTQTPTSQLPHKIPLLLPSKALHYFSVDSKLLEQEWALREAQAHDALAAIRGYLELRSHLYRVKDRFVRGQGPSTRTITTITACQGKIDHAARRYRTAYEALRRLSLPLLKDNTRWRDVLRPLDDSDIRHIRVDDDETPSESTRTISWIWQAAAPRGADAAMGGEDAQVSLQDTLRVEWCKARARARRWTEECDLVREEMRRVIAYHDYASTVWQDRIGKHYCDKPDYLEGATAYALRQSGVRQKMKKYCEHVWRFVDVWLNLSKDDSAVGDGGVGSEPAGEELPDLESIADSVLGVASTASLPLLEEMSDIADGTSSEGLPELYAIDDDD